MIGPDTKEKCTNSPIRYVVTVCIEMKFQHVVVSQISTCDIFLSRQRRTPTTAATNEMSVSVYGDIGSLFRLSCSDSSTATSPSSGGNSNLASASIVDTWSRPLSVSQRNIRLEDVFHAVSGQGGIDFALVFVTGSRLN